MQLSSSDFGVVWHWRILASSKSKLKCFQRIVHFAIYFRWKSIRSVIIKFEQITNRALLNTLAVVRWTMHARICHCGRHSSMWMIWHFAFCNEIQLKRTKKRRRKAFDEKNINKICSRFAMAASNLSLSIVFFSLSLFVFPSIFIINIYNLCN